MKGTRPKQKTYVQCFSFTTVFCCDEESKKVVNNWCFRNCISSFVSFSSDCTSISFGFPFFVFHKMISTKGNYINGTKRTKGLCFCDENKRTNWVLNARFLWNAMYNNFLTDKIFKSIYYFISKLFPESGCPNNFNTYIYICLYTWW